MSRHPGARLIPPGPPRWPLDDRAHPARRGHSAKSAAPHDLAYVHPGALAGTRRADFFTSEVWTARGLVAYYVAFLLDVQSRRVHVIGCTPYPDEAFVIQCLRQATAETGLLYEGRILLCDRDSEVESGCRAVAGNGRSACRSDAALRAELQRVR